jgi:hypothetical protein
MPSPIPNNLQIACLVIAVVVALALVLVPHAESIFNDKKAWEITTQFFFVAVLGGAVAVVYRAWEAARERRAVQRRLLEKFYRHAVAVHNEYKKIRRTLRATTIREPDGLLIERGMFEQQMDRLEDCQLKLESMKRDVKAQRELFGRDQKAIRDRLDTAEDYLRELLREYEGNYAERRVKAEHDLMEIAAHDLRDFITTKPPVNAEEHLFTPAEEVRDLVLGLIEKTTACS